MAISREPWWENYKKRLRRTAPATLVSGFISATWTSIARNSGIGEVEFITVDAALLAASLLVFVVVQRVRKS